MFESFLQGMWTNGKYPPLKNITSANLFLRIFSLGIACKYRKCLREKTPGELFVGRLRKFVVVSLLSHRFSGMLSGIDFRSGHFCDCAIL